MLWIFGYSQTLLHYRFDSGINVSEFDESDDGDEKIEDDSNNLLSKIFDETFDKIRANLAGNLGNITNELKNTLLVPYTTLSRCDSKKGGKKKSYKNIKNIIFIGLKEEYSKRLRDVVFVEVKEDGTVQNPFFGAFIRNFGVKCYPTVLTTNKRMFDTVIEGIDAIKVVTQPY